MSIRNLLISIALLLFFSIFVTSAQDDAFDLSTELYTLSNTGHIERVGLGIAGRATVTPEDEFVIDFGVAPDGIFIAYRTEDSLKLMNMLTGQVQTIESGTSGFPPFRGRGQTIAWSPNSEALVSTTDIGLRSYINGVFTDIPITPILHVSWSPDGSYLAAESEDNVWWIYRREASSLILHSAIPASYGVAWVEDAILMFAPDTGGLFLMDLANANAQAQIAEDDVIYRNPHLHAERAVYVFGRPVSDTLTVETGGFLYEATITDQWRVEQVSENSVDLNGLRWSPGGNLLTTLFGGILTLVDPFAATGLPLPLTDIVAYGWGPQLSGDNDITLTTDAYFLADDFVVGNQIWTLPRGTAPAAPITQVENTVQNYAVAPDGLTLAYVSEGDVFLLPATANEAVLVAEDAEPTALSFDASGQTLYYDVGTQIFAANLNDLSAEPLSILEGYSTPQSLPNGGLIVRIPDGDAAFFDPASGNLQRLGAYRKVKPLQDGRFIGLGAPISDDIDGLYLIEPDGSAPPALLYTPALGRRVVDAVEVAEGQIRLLAASSGTQPRTVEVWQQRTSGGAPLPVTDAGYIGEPVLSPDGQFIAGYASAAKTLSLYDIQRNVRAVLRQTPPITDFRWVAFR